MYALKYYVCVLTVILGGSAQFYSYGIINPSKELVTDWINSTYTARSNGTGPLSLTELNLVWSFVVSSVAVGAIVGALFVRVLAEYCGRRNGLLLNGMLNVAGAACQLFAQPLALPELLIVGRLMLGVCMGVTSGLVPMYLMEITPAKHRGPAGTLHQVAVAFSDWFSLLIGLPEVAGGSGSWPIAFALPGLFALALCIILPFCPESPRYLLMTRGERLKAKEAVRQFVGDQECDAAFDAIMREAILAEHGKKATWKELLSNPQFRIPLGVSITVMVAQQFTGCTAVFAFSTDMFISANLKPQNARFSTLAIGIVYFCSALMSPFLIERVGRRPLLLFQLASCMLSLTALSIFTALLAFQWAHVGTIISLVVYMAVYGVGSPIPWMITGELFCHKYRALAVTLSVFVSWTLAFVISTSYLPFQQLVGDALSYVPFIVGSTVLFTILYLLLPETRGRSPDAIVAEVRSRSETLSARQPRNTSRRVSPTSGGADDGSSVAESSLLHGRPTNVGDYGSVTDSQSA